VDRCPRQRSPIQTKASARHYRDEYVMAAPVGDDRDLAVAGSGDQGDHATPLGPGSLRDVPL
jgi:hypothetical protein